MTSASKPSLAATSAEIIPVSLMGHVSAMRVGSILALLKLHPEIQAWIRDLSPGTPPRQVTERALRPIVRLAGEAQLEAMARRWPAFTACPP